MKIAFGMIVYNGNYVLKECLEAIYPFASQILISEGCVQHFVDLGHTTSTDGTNETLENFPDPENKITVVYGTYPEKTEQANAYMKFMAPDTDYMWMVDSDEIYKAADLKRIIEILPQYTSMGIYSTTFYGGFDRTIGGFEANAEFKRIFKVAPGSIWGNHRPPQVTKVADINHCPASVLNAMGIRMFHYSYVWPQQVEMKVDYYKKKISKDNCISDYFQNVYMQWVKARYGQGDQYHSIEPLEKRYNGVHEFVQRGEAFTLPFMGEHPEPIKRNMLDLAHSFVESLFKYGVEVRI